MDTPKVIMAVEPSKRLSEIMGFPYYIERMVDIEDLCLTQSEKSRLKTGETIHKSIKVVT